MSQGSHYRLFSLLCLSLLLLELAALSASAPPLRPGKEDKRKSVPELIADLGSENYLVREVARRELKKRPEAAPALQKALESQDAEVVRGAREVLAVLAREGTLRSMARLQAWGKARKVDRIVEAIVLETIKGKEDACYDVATRMAADLLLQQRRCYHGCCPKWYDKFPAGPFADYLKGVTPLRCVSSNPGLDRGVFLARGETVTVSRVAVSSLILARGKVRISRGSNNVILANGPVEAERIGSSLIVCDGDCTIQDSMSNCLILANGDVRCSAGSFDCAILASGKVLSDNEQLRKRNMIREGPAELRRFVSFFDLRQEGLEVEAVPDGLRITAVRPKTLFARAGLEAGDVIVMVDGNKPPSSDAFRRLLRRKVVEENTAQLTVRRGKRTIQLPVPCTATR